MAFKVAAFCPLLIVLLVTTGAGHVSATDKTTTVACSAGLVAVKFGAGIICVAGPGGSNVGSGNQIGSGNGILTGGATDVTTAGNGGSITGRKLQGGSDTTTVACSAGLVAVKFGKGIICVAGAGGSNVFSGNQVLSGNGGATNGAVDVTTAGNGGSITGRKLQGGSDTTTVACSAGLVAVKFGKGIICVAGAGGSNIGSGNQIGSGNGFFGTGGATDVTTAGNGGSITGRKMLGSDTTVACSAGLVAVKFGTGIICVAGAGGSNVLSGNQVLSGNGFVTGGATDVTTAGNGGSITGRKLQGGSDTTTVACSAGLVAVKFGKGIICVAGAGGSNVVSGNQVLSGNGGVTWGAADQTTAGNGGSITGRKLQGGSDTTTVACSAGLVAVKFGKGIICVAGAGGSNLGSGNQIGSGNGFFTGGAADQTTAGNGGSITGR